MICSHFSYPEKGDPLFFPICNICIYFYGLEEEKKPQQEMPLVQEKCII